MKWFEEILQTRIESSKTWSIKVLVLLEKIEKDPKLTDID